MIDKTVSEALQPYAVRPDKMTFQFFPEAFPAYRNAG